MTPDPRDDLKRCDLGAHGPIPRGARVSPHFSAAELTTTEHVEFLAEQANPPEPVRLNLVRLAFDLLEPARALVGPLRVTSGYRCPALNAVLPGHSRTSRHMDGLAADVVPLEMDLRDAFRRLAASALPVDQLIFEHSRWIHVGAALHGHAPRGERLAIYTPGQYEPWNPQDPRFRAA